MKKDKAHAVTMFFLAAVIIASLGCASPLTKREEGALIGGGIGLASGAIIGNAVGHSAAGALIGGPIGLLAGALIGDELMQQDRRDYYQDREIARLRREIARLRWENERLRDRY